MNVAMNMHGMDMDGRNKAANLFTSKQKIK